MVERVLNESLDAQKNFIFDLDGTIIDSRRSIQRALVYVFNEAGIANKDLIEDIKIGPPLDQIIKNVCPESSSNSIRQVKDLFVKTYDEMYCTDCSLYEDAGEVLHQLSEKRDLHLVTNKRSKPTEKILEHFGISHLFSSVTACDSQGGTFIPKSESLNHMIKCLRIDRRNCYYLGDTEGDATACLESGIDFLFAAWGYGGDEINSRELRRTLRSWKDMLAI